MTKKPIVFSGDLQPPPKFMLAVDPGKSTGWVVFLSGKMVEFGIDRSIDEFDDRIDYIEERYGEPDVVVVELFKLFKHKALQQSGSELEAVQVIGMMKRQAKKWSAEYVTQHSNILSTAVIWSKLPMPSNHKNSHWIAAYNHGIYYLVKNNMILPTGVEVPNAPKEA